MVLLIDGIVQNKYPCNMTTFYEYFPKYKEKAKSFVETPIENVPPSRLLYVSQREFAVTTSHDNHINVIGSEDATTCIILVIHNLKSGDVGLSHLDGSDTKSDIYSLIEKILEQSAGGNVDLVVHMFGGYLDMNNYSSKFVQDIMNVLHNHSCRLTLDLICVGECNTIRKNGINWPIVYGVGVDIRTGRIFRASFQEKGPDSYLRCARLFCGNSQLMNIYNNSTGQLQIGPFDYRLKNNLDLWLEKDDQVLLQNFSSSPDVEPPNYVENVRKTFKFIRDNPFPLKTVFSNGEARTYKVDCVTGLWTIIRK